MFLKMKKLCLDDLKVGDRFKSEPLEVTEKQVIEFARKFDPQMFHLNRKRAERTIFKGLIASGWHTAAITMRLFVQTLNFAEGAIGLGIDKLRWPNVVRPGDVLTVETKIIHLAQRLNYLSSEEADALQQQTKLTFGCLHGLIKAVEKEAGKLSKLLATATSLIVIGLMRWSSGQLSVVM